MTSWSSSWLGNNYCNNNYSSHSPCSTTSYVTRTTEAPEDTTKNQSTPKRIQRRSSNTWNENARTLQKRVSKPNGINHTTSHTDANTYWSLLGNLSDQ